MQNPITASCLVSEHLVGNVRLGGKRKRKYCFFSVFFSRLSSWWLWSVIGHDSGRLSAMHRIKIRLNSWRLISAEPGAQRHCEDPNKGRHKNLSQYVAWRKMWQLWGTISDFRSVQLWWGLVLMVQKTSGLEMAKLKTHLQIFQQWKRHTFSLYEKWNTYSTKISLYCENKSILLDSHLQTV